MNTSLNTLAISCLLQFIITTSLAQNFDWAKKIGGSNSEAGNKLITDANGNLFTTGFFQGTADFDPGNGTHNLTSAGSNDIFVFKQNSYGDLVWAKRMGGTNADVGQFIAIDPSGYLYVTGHFKGTADFDPGSGTYNLTSAGGWDVFIAKLDTSGNFVWAKNLGGTGDDQVNSMAIDSTGNLLLTGSFWGSADFDPGSGTFTLTSAGSSDIFIAKLSASGNFLWAKRIGASFADEGRSISIDANNNVIIVGSFQGTADFDPGAGTLNIVSAGLLDIFVLKLDSMGNLNWAKSIGGTASDNANAVAVDHIGNIHLTGYYIGAVDFDPGSGIYMQTSAGSGDIYVAKLNAAGNLVWAKSIGSSSSDVGYSLCLDIHGNVYSSGNFMGSVDFDPGTGIYNLTDAGSGDMYILKLDSTGNFIWAGAINGTNMEWVHSIVVSPFGKIYTSGRFTGTADFNPGMGTSNLSATAMEDVFILSLSQCTGYSTGNISAVNCNAYTSPSGKYIWTTSGNYLDTISNSAGCDSVLSITLTINNSSASTLSTSSCNFYTAPSGLYTWTNSGTYVDTIPNALGCDSIITINLTIDTVDVGVTNTSPTLTANATNATYQWLDCSTGPISGASGQSFTATANGQYAVIVSQNGCIDTSQCLAITDIGFSEGRLGGSFKFYPNPTAGIIKVTLDLPMIGGEIRVTDVRGMLIYIVPLDHTREFDLVLDVPRGVYILRLILKDGTAQTQKILKL